MLIERQVSVFFVLTGGALMLPVCTTMYHHPEYAPGAALGLGTVLGALGVFFGSALAYGYTSKAASRFFLSCWTLLALVFAASAVTGAFHHPGLAGRVTFGGLALLPLAAVLVFWFPPRGMR